MTRQTILPTGFRTSVFSADHVPRRLYKHLLEIGRSKWRVVIGHGPISQIAASKSNHLCQNLSEAVCEAKRS